MGVDQYYRIQPIELSQIKFLPSGTFLKRPFFGVRRVPSQS